MRARARAAAIAPGARASRPPRRRAFRILAFTAAPALLLSGLSPSVHALEWSDTELHLQYGQLDVPSFAGGGKAKHLITTGQHAHGWKYGDNFVFLDMIDSRESGFQDFDLYGEWYSNFSLSKIAGRRIGGGLVADIGLVVGVNWADDAKVVKYLPGIRMVLDLNGFAFANLDITAYIDDSKGVASGGAPRESDSFMVDLSFARPFTLGEQDFSIEGHIEYIGSRKNRFGDKVDRWLLAQPQLRWRVTERLWMGIEYQYWMNKLGDGATDENTVQALLVWQF